MGIHLKLLGVTWSFLIIGLSQGLPVTKKAPAAPPASENPAENIEVCFALNLVSLNLLFNNISQYVYIM